MSGPDPGPIARTGRHAPPPSAGRGPGLLDRWLSSCLVLAILLTAILLAADASWLAELFAHFRVQYVIVGGVLLVTCAALRHYGFVFVLAICVAVYAWPLLPYWGSENSPRAAGDAISILSANVLASNGDAGRLLDLIASQRPDLLLVLEHTPAFDAALTVLYADYPYRLLAPADDAFGIALYSRLPLSEAETFSHGASDAVRATVTGPAGRFRFIGVHFLPPTGASKAAARDYQIAALAEAVAQEADEIVVCGDFNLTPYSPRFKVLREVGGLADPRAGRGFARTWPVGYLPLGIPIDHCLTGGAMGVSDVRTLGDIGSDHYPLLIEVTPGNNR